MSIDFHKIDRIHINYRKKILILLSFSASICAISAPAYAKEAEALLDNNGDIIVTAQRRAEPLQRTPIAVGLLSEEVINQRNVSQMRDLAGTIPGLFLPKTNSVGVQQIYIRGIGTSSPIYNGAVATYVDDVYLPRILNSAVFGSPDLERIEVLRGPQGTLYGQNTSAGAVKIISRDPGNEFDGWVSGSLGNYKAREAKLYLSAPLVADKLSFSIAALHQENEGYVRNLFLGHHVNGTRVSFGRAKLKFTPSERVSFVLAGELAKDTSDNAVGTPANYPGTRPRVTFDDRELQQDYKQYAISLHAKFELNDHLEFRSITAYRDFTNDPSTWSTDGVPGDQSGFQLNIDDNHFSQEFQLNGDYQRFKFTVGAIHFQEDYKQNRPAWSRSVYTGISSQTKVKSYAVYAQGRYGITDSLGVTVGARYNVQRDRFNWFGYRSNVDLDILAVTGSVSNLRQKTDGIVPKFGVDYQVSPDVFTYASITKGEKAGGYNAVAGSVPVASVPLEPEKVTAYEAGTKLALFDKRVRLNFAAFFNQFNDYHAVVQNPIVNGQQLNIPLITNAAKAETYGLEFDGTARVGRDLDLRLTATYLHAKFKQFDNPTGAAASDYTGNVMPRAPKLAINSGFTYTVPLHVPGKISFGGDVEYVSKTYEDIALTQPVQRYALVSGNLLYVSADEHWRFSVTVKNVFDKTFRITKQIIAAAGTEVYTYNAPRTFLATLRYDF